MKNLLVGLLLFGSISNITLAQENIITEEIVTGDKINLENDLANSSSMLVITNKSRANTLDIVILGAPTNGIDVTLYGKPLPSLNGFISIPPNSPYYKLQAFGDFKETTITIGNITNPQNGGATAQVQLMRSASRQSYVRDAIKNGNCE